MTDRREETLRLAVLKVLTARLGTAKDLTSEQVRGWEVGDRNAAVLPSGARVGQVTLAKGRDSAAVTDDTVFIRWVRLNYPSELQTVEQVNPAFKARILSAARQLGEPVDGETGEVVPGVTVQTGDPFPTVRLEANADELIAAAWQSGELMELVGSLLRRAVEAGEP